MNLPRDVAAHLRLFAELGVNGISRDSTWRDRMSLPRQSVDATLATTQGDLGSVIGRPDALIPEASAESPGRDAGNEQPDSRVSEPTGPSLDLIRAEIGDCTRCPLHALGRRQIVFGVGNPQADLMFVGEAPGADEDLQGEPFVGRAGQLLTKIIEAIGLSRSDVYIANVIKCRPPGNRNPDPIEVATCQPFLLQQIDTIRPKVIVALGTFAAQALLETDTPISRLRGRVQQFRGGIKLVPTFHPAFLLRSPDRKRDVWEDMKLVRDLLSASD